jgi:hypothetical protein
MVFIAPGKDFIEVVACLGIIGLDLDASGEAEQPVLVAAVDICVSE